MEFEQSKGYGNNKEIRNLPYQVPLESTVEFKQGKGYWNNKEIRNIPNLVPDNAEE